MNENSDTSRPYRIVIAALDGALLSSLYGLHDFFDWANQALERAGAIHRPFEILLAAQGGAAPAQALRPGVTPLTAITHCDAVLIPALSASHHCAAGKLSEQTEVLDWLRHHHAHGAWLAASCSGVFILGEAGLLDRRRCTTTWWLHEAFKQRFPRAIAVRAAAPIEDERILTAGGALSWVDISLHIVRALAGVQAATLVADFAMIDSTPRAQAVYLPQGQLLTQDPFLLSAEQVVRKSGQQGLSAGELAGQLATSERTLHRRLKAATGESPLVFIARVRLERARVLLEQPDLSIRQIAVQTGYRDEGSFRRAFQRFAGMTPTGYRKWAIHRR